MLTTAGACVAATAYAGAPRSHTLEFTGGVFHGPGHMADSPLPSGRLAPLVMESGLQGHIEYFNNGREAPNLPSEAAFEPHPDGRLSNGVAFNEHMDGGIAEVGRGAMRFLTVVAHTDQNRGVARTYLDRDLNWHLRVDLALDPGFPEGLIVIEDLDITTGAAEVPKSRQSAEGHAGGIDRAGSLRSGTQVVGRLGDYDADGFLDGVFVGVTSIPTAHLFTPGAPAVQVRNFSTDIPIGAWDAAAVMVSSLANFKSSLAPLGGRPSKASDEQRSAARAAVNEMTARIDSALALLKRAPSGASQLDTLGKLRGTLERCTHMSTDQAGGGPGGDCADFPQGYFREIASWRERIARQLKGAQR